MTVDPRQFDEIRRTAIKNESDISTIKAELGNLSRKTSALERAILGDKYAGGRAVRDIITDIEKRLIHIEVENRRMRLIAAGLLSVGIMIGWVLAQLLTVWGVV